MEVIIKEIEIKKGNQIEFLKLKSTIIEMRNSLRFNSRFEQERVGNLKIGQLK